MILISKILTAGLAEMGYEVKMSEIHGMSQRGGSVSTQIKYGESVYAPNIGLAEADMVISIEKAEALRALPPEMFQLAVLQAARGEGGKDLGEADNEEIVLRTRRADLAGRTPNQTLYLRNILGHDITFGIGPAGTGKTYLAVAAAVEALNQQEVRRILLVRPAVEAGEKLGFLPGDLTQKVDPYLRPLYDALYEMLGVEKVVKLLEKNVIEIAPLAYMRGRTLNDAFVILDEAQNTTIEQMKMFLTRLGFGSTAVVTGDMTQIDLPKHVKSGLKDAIDVLRGVEGVSFTFFEARDVVRHPLVARIVNAYDRRDAQDRETGPA